MPDYVLVRDDGTASERFMALNADDALANGPEEDGELYVRVVDGEPEAPVREPDWTAFSVIVEPLAYGYRVKVVAPEWPGAEVYAAEIDTALAMTMPYMRAVCVPDPLLDIFRAPSAPDGPPETG